MTAKFLFYLLCLCACCGLVINAPIPSPAILKTVFGAGADAAGNVGRTSSGMLDNIGAAGSNAIEGAGSIGKQSDGVGDTGKFTSMRNMDTPTNNPDTVPISVKPDLSPSREIFKNSVQDPAINSIQTSKVVQNPNLMSRIGRSMMQSSAGRLFRRLGLRMRLIRNRFQTQIQKRRISRSTSNREKLGLHGGMDVIRDTRATLTSQIKDLNGPRPNAWNLKF